MIWLLVARRRGRPAGGRIPALPRRPGASAGPCNPVRTRRNSPTRCRSRATRTRRTCCCSAIWSGSSPPRPPPWCSTATTARTGWRRWCRCRTARRSRRPCAGPQPRSCLAVRSGRTHREGSSRLALLSCAVCAPCPGASSCVPLVVGGKVIGSVLLSRPTPYDDADEQRIRESVSQAAPVLANLRNLAIAEIPRRHRRPHRPAQQAGGDRHPEADVRAGSDGKVAAGAAHARPRPLQAGQRPARARGGRPGPGQRRRGDAERACGPGTSPAATAERSSRSCCPTPRSRRRCASPSGSARRSPRCPCPAPTSTVTVSVGVAGYPEHASTPDRLARLADAALYLAKRQGRNRVELAEPSVVVGAFDAAGQTGPAGQARPADPGVPAAPTAATALAADPAPAPGPPPPTWFQARVPAETGRPQQATAKARRAAGRATAASERAIAAMRETVANP